MSIPMKPIDIRILIMKAGTSQSQIARELGVTQGFVGQVILGLRHTKRIQDGIAGAVGKPSERIWPKQNSKKRAA
jgi:lambda repressor-like predicted transcriptional regulator